MVRRIMSDDENERQKQRIRSFLHNGRRVEESYPQIEKIEINYMKEHNSFVGHNEKDGRWTITPQSEMYFGAGVIVRNGKPFSRVLRSQLYAKQKQEILKLD